MFEEARLKVDFQQLEEIRVVNKTTAALFNMVIPATKNDFEAIYSRISELTMCCRADLNREKEREIR